MQKLKDCLSTYLGIFGIILWYIFTGILLCTPLVFLELPIYIDVIIIVVMMTSSLIGGFVEFGVWAWSFVDVLAKPFNGLSLLYFILFGIYFITTLLPNIISIIIAIINSFKKSV